MPFICNYCQGTFCSDHRLPENHNCKNIGRAVSPQTRTQQPRQQARQYQEPAPRYSSSEAEYTEEEPGSREAPGEVVDRYYEPDGTEVIVRRVPIYAIEKPENPIWYFSKIELQHLAVGIILMFGVGISMFFSIYLLNAIIYGTPITPDWGLTLLLAGFATLAFLIHEMGHKFVGIRLGNWSEFRLIKAFTILTAISVIPIPFFKIVCPGAVQVTGDTKTENMGKIALAGPSTNLIQAAIFVILANLFFLTADSMFQVCMIAAYLNSFLGIFNLIPLGPLDGLKVIRWNKVYYFLTVGVLLGFLIYVFPRVSL